MNDKKKLMDRVELGGYILMIIIIIVLYAALSSCHSSLKLMKKQAIEYGHGETNRISGEFQWNDKGK